MNAKHNHRRVSSFLNFMQPLAESLRPRLSFLARLPIPEGVPSLIDIRSQLCRQREVFPKLRLQLASGASTRGNFASISAAHEEPTDFEEALIDTGLPAGKCA
eukprot:6178391-Pleurochrysis_carterae.AAC.3